MRKIAFITPEQTGYGFQLTGAQQFYAKKKNMLDILKQAMSEPGTGIIIIDERLLTEKSEVRLKEIEQIWNGILLVLPSPKRPEAEVEDYAARLLRKAIGYHVRLRI
jgi:V/A-type H+-transporting ATPase subunit F